MRCLPPHPTSLPRHYNSMVRYACACSQVAHATGRPDSGARIRNQGTPYEGLRAHKGRKRTGEGEFGRRGDTLGRPTWNRRTCGLFREREKFDRGLPACLPACSVPFPVAPFPLPLPLPAPRSLFGFYDVLRGVTAKSLGPTMP